MKARSHSNRPALTPGEQPAYTLADAARYLKLPQPTLRSWILGRGYPTRSGTRHFRPLIRPAQAHPLFLSFSNLIEAHVLRALRTEHGVSVQALREALGYAEKRLGVERLLLSPELRTEGGSLFLDRYRALINLSASGQLAMRKVFEDHLKRVEWNDSRIPIRIYPFLTSERVGPERPIAIDPRIAFGRPVLARKSISTQVIAQRIDAGEAVPDLAADYELSPAEIEDAVLYEHAA